MDDAVDRTTPPDTGAPFPVVELEGELDLAVAPMLRQRLESLLASGATTIAVDLLDVTFLDSTALGVLVGALKQCQRAGGDLHLVVTEPRILKVLEITGLTGAFPIHDRLDGLHNGSGPGATP
jgi:anti-sigma B factor antagonist